VLERRGLGFGGMVTTTKGLKGGCVVVVVIIFVVVVEPSGFRTWGKEGRGTTTARGEDTSSSSSSALTLTSMPSTPIPAVERPQLQNLCCQYLRQVGMQVLLWRKVVSELKWV
jgi:hypothetical protein